MTEMFGTLPRVGLQVSTKVMGWGPGVHGYCLIHGAQSLACRERASCALTLRVSTVAMPAPSDPPKQYMRLCTNSQRPAPVMLLSDALFSHEVPPAQKSTIVQHIFHGAEHL